MAIMPEVCRKYPNVEFLIGSQLHINFFLSGSLALKKNPVNEKHLVRYNLTIGVHLAPKRFCLILDFFFKSIDLFYFIH